MDIHDNAEFKKIPQKLEKGDEKIETKADSIRKLAELVASPPKFEDLDKEMRQQLIDHILWDKLKEQLIKRIRRGEWGINKTTRKMGSSQYHIMQYFEFVVEEKSSDCLTVEMSKDNATRLIQFIQKQLDTSAKGIWFDLFGTLKDLTQNGKGEMLPLDPEELERVPGKIV